MAVVVTVDDDHTGRLAEVVARLQAAGMAVDETLGAVGVVTGTVDESDLAALGAVRGVGSVERSRSFRLPPPDAPIQ